MAVALGVAGAAAYLYARNRFGDDALLGFPLLALTLNAKRADKWDRYNLFYTLEDRARSRKNANVPFIAYGGQQWTYKEVYDITLQYAAWLKSQYAIVPGEVVAMDFMNSEQFIFLWMAIWSLGARPAFINYNLAGDPLLHCIRVSTARIVFVGEETKAKFDQELLDKLTPPSSPDSSGAIVVVFFDLQVRQAIEKLEGVREPDSSRAGAKGRDMAALIYTSGTTGLPKPGIVSWSKHRTGGDFCYRWLGMRPGDRFYTYVGETLRYLLSAPPATDPSSGEIIDRKHNVRLAFGNGLRPDVWNRFKDRFGIETIAEFYGATEAPSAVWNLSSNDFSKGAIGRNGLLGELLFSLETAIVKLDWVTEAPLRSGPNNFCTRVPRGEPGELLQRVNADQIEADYQGYFNNTKATQSKVMRDVLAKGDAYFRTGDVVRWDKEGRWWFVDRIGDTFRWKSENVSTAEVSEALGSYAAIDEVNVYGVEIPHHDGRAGCAAVTFNREVDQSLLDGLAEHATQKLPRYAVPLFIRTTKDMGRTGNNKQQKHLLRAQGVMTPGADRVFWLQGGRYVEMGDKERDELNGGRARL
ncbi:MAG: hypothetical protein Q9191_002353 [Dirinaria sp. TL-2023a]